VEIAQNCQGSCGAVVYGARGASAAPRSCLRARNNRNTVLIVPVHALTAARVWCTKFPKLASSIICIRVRRTFDLHIMQSICLRSIVQRAVWCAQKRREKHTTAAWTETAGRAQIAAFQRDRTIHVTPRRGAHDHPHQFMRLYARTFRLKNVMRAPPFSDD
jgi:hypothetical protein